MPRSRWITAVVVASLAVASGSIAYVVATHLDRSGAQIREHVLGNLRETAPGDFESNLGATTLVFPASSWGNARAAGVPFVEVLRRVGDNAWLVIDDVARKLRLSTIYFTSLYRVSGTGPHTTGNGIDFGYVQRPGEPLVLLKRIGGEPSVEPVLARELREALARSPVVSQILGPWWMHSGSYDRRNDMVSPLDVEHLTHIHVTTRGVHAA